MAKYYAEINPSPSAPHDRLWQWSGESPFYRDGAPYFNPKDELYLSVRDCAGMHRIVLRAKSIDPVPNGDKAKPQGPFPFEGHEDDFKFDSDKPLIFNLQEPGQARKVKWTFDIAPPPPHGGPADWVFINPGDDEFIDPEFHVGPGDGY